MTNPAQHSEYQYGSIQIRSGSWIFGITVLVIMLMFAVKHIFKTVLITLPHKNTLGENWVIFLRIPRTSSTFLTETVDIISHRRCCDWDKCKCQTGSVAPHIHGKPCYQMTCIDECNQLGSRVMWKDAPHADWLEIQRGLEAAKIPKYLVSIMTMLRKPTDRLKSEFSYILGRLAMSRCNSTEKYIYAWDYTVPCNYSLIDLFNDRLASLRFTNRQTRMLAGVGGFGSEIFYDDDEDMLRTAKIHLRNMAWFGLTERIDDSIWLLAHQSLNLGMKMSISLSLSNRSTIRSRAMMLPYMHAKFKAKNNLDERLYAYAVHLFNDRLSSAKLDDAVSNQMKYY